MDFKKMMDQARKEKFETPEKFEYITERRVVQIEEKDRLSFNESRKKFKNQRYLEKKKQYKEHTSKVPGVKYKKGYSNYSGGDCWYFNPPSRKTILDNTCPIFQHESKSVVENFAKDYELNLKKGKKWAESFKYIKIIDNYSENYYRNRYFWGKYTYRDDYIVLNKGQSILVMNSLINYINKFETGNSYSMYGVRHPREKISDYDGHLIGVELLHIDSSLLFYKNYDTYRSLCCKVDWKELCDSINLNYDEVLNFNTDKCKFKNNPLIIKCIEDNYLY